MNEKIKLSFDSKVYDKQCIMKATYQYIEDFWIDIELDEENNFVVIFEAKKDDSLINKINVLEFKNDLLYQSIRKQIVDETKEIRQIILGRAFYGTSIEVEAEQSAVKELVQEEPISDEKFVLENILVNWFEKNE